MAKETKKEGQVPAAYDWSATQGPSGFENVRPEDKGVPFLSILQKGSPQVDPAHPEHQAVKIENARAGDIFNSLSNAVVAAFGRNPLQFIPCSFEKLYMEWKTRESGGGMVKAHKSAEVLNECKRNERGQDVLPSGNIIVTTAYFYGLVVGEGESYPAVIGMSSTQLSKSRRWLNLMTAIKMDGPNGKFTPPSYSHIYGISAVPESNNKGNWFGWNISVSGVLTDPNLITKAIETSKSASNGQRTALPSPAEEA